MCPYASVSPSAANSSFFGMASRARQPHVERLDTSVRLHAAPSNHCADLLTEWSWTGLLASSKLLRGLSWGVSCLRTDCKENQDGWAVQVYACTLGQLPPTVSSPPSGRVASEPSGELQENTIPDKVSKRAMLGPIPTAPSETSSQRQNDRKPVSDDGSETASRRVSLSPSFAKEDFLPTFSFSWNHELTSLNPQLSGLLKAPTSQAVSLPLTPQPPQHRTNSLSEACRETYIGSSTFVVLDGHGAGGRDAAAAVEKAFDTVFSRILATGAEPQTDLISPLNLLDSVNESLQLGQKLIEKLNRDTQRDFGTTCVSVTLVNDVLISTSCGDSSALLFAFPPGIWSNTRRPAPLVVELSRRHNLEDRDELRRISEEGKGRVIRGDGGVLRLIPGDIEYEEAKRRGLSINMGRSMGHGIFKECGLSNEVDYSFLALKQIPKLLTGCERAHERHHRLGSGAGMLNRCFRLPPLSFYECRKIIDTFPTGVRKPRSETHRPSTNENVLTRHSFDLSEDGRNVDFSTRSKGLDSLSSKHTDSSVGQIGDMFLLLMSDGVTDVLSSTCIVDMLRDFDSKWRAKKRPFDPSAFALTLTQVARERRIKACQRADNCTCLAVHLISKTT